MKPEPKFKKGDFVSWLGTPAYILREPGYDADYNAYTYNAIRYTGKGGESFDVSQERQLKPSTKDEFIKKASRTLLDQLGIPHTKGKRQASQSTPATSSTKSDTVMTTAEKTAFKKRMADGRAKATRAAGTIKKATAAKKSTAATAKKKSTVKAKATGVKSAKTARKKTATKKATTARTTTRVKSAEQQKGANFIQEVDKLADRIHEKSATGQFVQVPVYRVSRSKAKSQAFKALSTARKTKNVTNIRLKA